MKPTQSERILERMEKSDGAWVSGQVFLREMFISQFHARIFDLQKKGYDIEASTFTDQYGFKSYRIIPKQQTLL